MSPESVSSLFPQRPIRPLPKRRLRERLSPEVADSIEYPRANRNASPLFYYPSIVPDETSSRTLGLNGGSRGGAGYGHGIRGNTGNAESDEEELALSNSKVVRRSHPEILDRAPAMPSKLVQPRHPNPQPPPSTTSSADGYEFENTNNKKKRKIPTVGDSALSGAHSLTDLSLISVSTATSPSNEHSDMAGSASPSYYGAGSFVANNQGISGPGRGRFGRSRNGRSPLRALSDAANNWVGRGAKIRQPQWATSNEHPGIISSAIANAEKLPSAPGQENVSLLRQHSSSVKSSPTATQFTFTCDSQVPKPQWPGTDPSTSQNPLPYGPSSKPRHASMGTQTPSGPSGAHVGENAAPTKTGSQPGTSKKMNRRSLEKELATAAKERRRQAKIKYQNEKHMHRPEDMWICIFCEYERIFGEPPRALIRSYEIKDQKARRKEAERKRLLEKAKAKGRKGKKAAKSPGKVASPQSQQQAGSTNVPVPAAVSNPAQDNFTNDEYTNEDYPRDEENDEYESPYSQDDPPMLLSDDPDQDEIYARVNCENCCGHGEGVGSPANPK